ncbi:HNH endonuclease [Thioalkalivibrio sp. ALJ15]|uniref:HNH endonuclease n=1 Tax=Thioalkalivibrio sp. ALJ15 TaxID=748652 RepID=UPI00037B3053|nr:HNH endonuclease [Thioalkalivibrio sp. ALJ15]
MSFWWVNHKQTYRQEIQGGYLWSPKFRSDGVRNHFYDNMTKVQPGDVVFSYAGGLIQDVGVATRTAQTAPKPSDFGREGDAWSDEGWLVEVQFHPTHRPLRPKDHIAEIAPLLPSKYAPINVKGDGNQVAYLASISPDLGRLLLTLLDGVELHAFLDDASTGAARAEEEQALEDSLRKQTDIRETDKQQLILSRRGQGVFRRDLEKIEPCCRVTGLSERQHLRASHIKPWSHSTNEERLDGNNGLLLAPNVDHLFDRGYVSFSDQGQIMLSARLTTQAAEALCVNNDIQVGGFNSRQAAYLAYHREKVFQL